MCVLYIEYIVSRLSHTFFVGGGGVEGGRGVSEEVKTVGEAPPPLNDRLPRTIKN